MPVMKQTSDAHNRLSGPLKRYITLLDQRMDPTTEAHKKISLSFEEFKKKEKMTNSDYYADMSRERLIQKY